MTGGIAATEQFLCVARERLGSLGVLEEAADLVAYEASARHQPGKARAVVRPRTTDDVSFLVKEAHTHQVGLVVQGANTGLVMGSTPRIEGDQVVLSTQRLNMSVEIDVVDRTARVGAGVELATLNERALASDLQFPIDLGANPTIGGMIATNTGGARLIRYGDVRRHVLGLEVVLMDRNGTVLSVNRGLRKDNTGADLKQLFIGTGGNFGIVTQATVELRNMARQTATALAVPSSLGAGMRLLEILEKKAGDFLSAYEGISRNAIQSTLTHVSNLRSPFLGAIPAYSFLVELETSLGRSAFDLDAYLEAVLSEAMETEPDLLGDVIVGKGGELWAIRHSIFEGLRAEGRVIAFDVSMRRSALAEFLPIASEITRRIHEQLKVCDFGHFGDGGVHFNIVCPPNLKLSGAAEMELRDSVYDLVVNRFSGSFSAEHGVGPYNENYWKKFLSATEKGLENELKQTLDPSSLLGRLNYSGV